MSRPPPSNRNLEANLEVVKKQDKVQELSKLLGDRLLGLQVLDGVSTAERVENLGKGLL